MLASLYYYPTHLHTHWNSIVWCLKHDRYLCELCGSCQTSSRLVGWFSPLSCTVDSADELSDFFDRMTLSESYKDLTWREFTKKTIKKKKFKSPEKKGFSADQDERYQCLGLAPQPKFSSSTATPVRSFAPWDFCEDAVTEAWVIVLAEFRSDWWRNLLGEITVTVWCVMNLMRSTYGLNLLAKIWALDTRLLSLLWEKIYLSYIYQSNRLVSSLTLFHYFKAHLELMLLNLLHLI